MTLTLANIEGEHVKSTIKDGLVPDIALPEGTISSNVDSLQPVDSHGIEYILNWLAISDSTLKSSSNLISLGLELVFLSEQEVIESLLKINESSVLIRDCVCTSSFYILDFFEKHVILVDEGSLSLSLVIFKSVFEPGNSFIELITDFLFSLSLNDINLGINENGKGYSSCSIIIRSFCAYTVVTKDVSVGLKVVTNIVGIFGSSSMGSKI